MAAKWSQRELNMLAQNLVDGFPVQSMEELIPTRNIGGIILKAQDFDFGIKTSKVDGITRFYVGLKSRTKHATALSEIDEINSIASDIEVAQPNVTVSSNSIDYLEPETRIIAYDGFSANALAVRMLDENNLNGDPEIIYQLSLHILKGMS
jgi:hypothetical protein